MAIRVTETQTPSTTRTWSYTTQVFVPPRSRVVSSFIVNGATYNVPFTAVVTVRGLVYITFSNNTYYAKEIDFLIEEAGWAPSTFRVNTTGTLDGVVGESFTARTDEYELDGTERVMGEVVDRGFWSEGQLVSAPAELAPEPVE